jgi:hypothetical protein
MWRRERYEEKHLWYLSTVEHSSTLGTFKNSTFVPRYLALDRRNARRVSSRFSKDDMSSPARRNAFWNKMLRAQLTDFVKYLDDDSKIGDTNDRMFFLGLESYLSFFSNVSKNFDIQVRNYGAAQILLPDHPTYNFNYGFIRRGRSESKIQDNEIKLSSFSFSDTNELDPLLFSSRPPNDNLSCVAMAISRKEISLEMTMILWRMMGERRTPDKVDFSFVKNEKYTQHDVCVFLEALYEVFIFYILRIVEDEKTFSSIYSRLRRNHQRYSSKEELMNHFGEILSPLYPIGTTGGEWITSIGSASSSSTSGSSSNVTVVLPDYDGDGDELDITRNYS